MTSLTNATSGIVMLADQVPEDMNYCGSLRAMLCRRGDCKRQMKVGLKDILGGLKEPKPIAVGTIYDFRGHMRVHHPAICAAIEGDYPCYQQAMEADELRKYFSMHHTTIFDGRGREFFVCLNGECGKYNRTKLPIYSLEESDEPDGTDEPESWKTHLIAQHGVTLLNGEQDL